MPTLEKPKPFRITKPAVLKLVRTVDAGLCYGSGKPKPGHMCVEQAVCYALGLPFNDSPECVSPAVRSAKITLNDAAWSSNAARAKGMKKLAIAQLGTAGVINDVEFAQKLAELTIRRVVPRALRIAAPLATGDYPATLEAAAIRCEQQGSYDAARAASYAASAASYAASAARAASDAASYAASAASAARAASDAARAASAASAARAASAASYAARAASAASAASDAASYAASAASAASARDAELTFFADIVLEVLIALKAPGAKWVKYAEAA